VSQGVGKNGQNPSDNKTQGRSSHDELDSPKNATREKNPGGPAVTPVGTTIGFKPTNADGEFQYTPVTSLPSTAKARLKGPSKMPTRRLDVTEADEIDVVEQMENTQEIKETSVREEIPSNIQKRTFSPSKARVNGQMAQRPRQEIQRKRTPGITSDNENAMPEPDLRRKLGDMTRRYETLEARFRTLREIGIVEASANVEKLRKQCEATAASANELIASLKKELAAQTALGQQARTLEEKVKERDSKMTGLESQVKDLSSQLSSAHIEITTLQTKLAAARNASTAVDGISSKGPGSAVKGTGANRPVVASAETALAAQLKEDLYSDLTGLIIRDVKKRESDHVYDCIQTGINGTLHFKLAVSHDADCKTASSLDAAEFHYMPLLDTNRDKELVDLLPEYLAVDITFSRQHAWKFYTRVIDTLAKRRRDS
jgi:hypothetical protein